MPHNVLPPLPQGQYSSCNISGNRELGIKYVSVGKSMLTSVLQQCSWLGLKQQSMTREMEDGTRITVNHCWGVNKIFIDSPCTPEVPEPALEGVVLEVPLLTHGGPPLYDPWFFMIKVVVDEESQDDPLGDAYCTNPENPPYAGDTKGLEHYKQIFQGIDLPDGPWEREWMDQFARSAGFVNFPEEGRSFTVEAYSSHPAAWKFCEEYPDHPISSHNEDNHGDMESPPRPRNIAPFADPIVFKEWRDIILFVDAEVNSWGYAAEGRDIWRLSDKDNPGDCEDQALTKMQILYEKGVPATAMDLILCKLGEDSSFSNHALAVVMTDMGMVYLDNAMGSVPLPTGVWPEGVPNVSTTAKSFLSEETHSNVFLFSRCWKGTVWGDMGASAAGNEGFGGGAAWEIPEDGVVIVELDEEIKEARRFGLFCPTDEHKVINEEE